MKSEPQDTQPTIAAAAVLWRDGAPFAPEYGDVYYSGNGIDEVERVFVGPSELREKMRRTTVTVGELGFGTGLNFAVCAQHFQADLAGGNTHRLHFISFEAHPLAETDWHKVVQQRQADLPIYRELARKPLPHLKGWHRRALLNGRIMLSVYYGDVKTGLASLAESQRVPVDVWWLDGFAPARNPAMWDGEVFTAIARTCAAHATVATFTAAGHVRRGLAEAGFEMRRVSQQPFKRESLAGHMRNASSAEQTRPPSEVAVEGAGIAGAWIAATLAGHGVRVHVYDPHGPASGASKMTATILHGRLLGDGSVQASLRANALHHAHAAYLDLPGYNACGVRQVGGPNMDARKMRRIAERYGADTPEQKWLQVRDGGLWFPTAGIVDLPAIIAELLDHPLINIHRDTNPREPETRTSRVPRIPRIPRIVCTGDAIRDEWPWIESASIYGQLDEYRIPLHSIDQLPPYPVIGNGYFVPDLQNGGFTLGATYEYHEWDPGAATQHNEDINIHYIDSLDYTWLTRRRGARAVTSDRTPVVGQMDDYTWIASAYGSMGTTFAPYLADVVVSRLLGHVSVAAPNIRQLLDPIRFKQRQARRGIKHPPR